MQITRRTLLASAAPAAALVLGACSTTQIASFEAQWSSIVTTIQADVAAAAQYIPTAETIAATVAGLFGPQWQAAVAAGEAVVNQVVGVLTQVATQLTPPAAARMRSHLAKSSFAAPVAIGKTSPTIYAPNGVTVTGFKVG
jgi:hypothetical protein